MSVLAIGSVTVRDDAPLAGFALDAPVSGATSTRYTLKLSGWAVGEQSRVVSLLVTHESELLCALPVTLERPDVDLHFGAKSWASRSGFWSLVGLIGLPLSFEVDLEVVLEDGSRHPVATIRGERQRIRSSYVPTLNPLLVTSLGRTGTTLLMRLLLDQPEIVARDEYPYETRQARYWAHAFKVLADPGHREVTSHPNTFYSDINVVGHNPYHFGGFGDEMGDWFGRESIEHLAGFIQASIDGFYLSLAQKQGRETPRYFAEKQLPDHIPRVLRELYDGVREIFLVRDPRDMFASIIAFNKKRGSLCFGAENAVDEHDLLARLRQDVMKFMRSWQSRRRDSILIKYEDLVLRPRETLGQVFDYLRVASVEERTKAAISSLSHASRDLKHHGTSSDAAASIGRWKSDFDGAFLTQIDDAFDDGLVSFGYRTHAQRV